MKHIFIVSLVFCLYFSRGVFAQPVAIRSGDIVLTRNTDTIGNPNGYFNHVAIVFESNGRYFVAEMQQKFDGCISVTSSEFFRRYPEYMILRYGNSIVAKSAGKHAEAYVGQLRYGKIASARLFVNRVKKDNCVSFVRRCYKNAGIPDMGWLKPDGVYRRGHFGGFIPIAHFRYIDHE